MLGRRSIRKYKPEQITDGELDAILEAGLYAPNAGGRQSPIIIVCQNAETNDALGKINKAAFHGRMSTEKAYVSKDQPSIADDASIVSGFYGAPTVLTLFAPRNFLYSGADCYAAAANITLAAHSLGIGSCIVARAEDTFASEPGRALVEKLGVAEGYEAKVHVTLGYPADNIANAKPRKENRVLRFS
jgi:nitroreductase